MGKPANTFSTTNRRPGALPPQRVSDLVQNAHGLAMQPARPATNFKTATWLLGRIGVSQLMTVLKWTWPSTTPFRILPFKSLPNLTEGVFHDVLVNLFLVWGELAEDLLFNVIPELLRKTLALSRD